MTSFSASSRHFRLSCQSSCWLLPLALLLGVSCQIGTSTDSSEIPTFSVLDLSSRSRRQELKEILSSTGLLAVRFSENRQEMEYPIDRFAALQGLCECHDHPNFLTMDQTHSMRLLDDQTVRTSVATATVGLDHPLPLPEPLEDLCGPETVSAMERLRDAVSEVSRAFVVALEDLVEGHQHAKVPLLRDSHGDKRYSTITSIVESANHLEHFHVYTKETPHYNDHAFQQYDDSNHNDSAAWDWHTDAGLFLVFVPALNCHEPVRQDSSFWYQDAQGNPVQAHFDEARTAIVMLGQGAQDWLNLASTATSKDSLKLKATVHSLRWNKKQPNATGPRDDLSHSKLQRAWYGMMYLVPETAMIYGTKTLKEIRSSLSWSRNSNSDNSYDENYSSVVSFGCGDEEPSFNLVDQQIDQDNWNVIPVKPRRRRMQHQDPSACNNVTNFFCWMQCLDIPNANQAQGYVNEGYSLYCLDPAILSSSGNRVSEAAAPCESGWVHNANCLGLWEPTAPGVPAAQVNVTADASDVEQPFCYSGTTMYMDGFHFVQSTTCIIYLFQSWVLDTGGKYALAFFGTIVLGMFLEKLIQQRRKIMANMQAGRMRLLVSATFYGIQLTIGYMLMLVIMIYAGALFIATVLGLVFGHVLFNAKDALWPLKASANAVDTFTPETGTDGCSDREGSTDDQDQTETRNSLVSHRVETYGATCSIVEMTAEVSNQPSPTPCSPGELSSYVSRDSADLVDTTEDEWSKSHLEDQGQKVAISACCQKKVGAAKSKKECADQGIPEGGTPCCQYNSYD